MSFNHSSVLVTGADGFIGSHLTEMLVKNGAKVTESKINGREKDNSYNYSPRWV